MCLAVPGKIIKIGENFQADVDFGGVVRSIQLDLLPLAKRGDFVLVHAGFAIQKIAKKDAKETTSLLKEAFGEIKNLV